MAIDGPVASGKSAVGSRIARRLGYRFVDTGMMYRALTWLALQRGIDLHDEQALAKLAGDVTMTVELGPPAAPEAGRVHVDGMDATGHLRTTEVGEAVSLVSRVPAVRAAMVRIQRELAREGGVVMAGRDIGTVVLPDAGLKVYLDASAAERARRRHEELQAIGREETLADVQGELALRDEIDSGRSASPLRPADDALVIETGRLSLDAVVDRIMEALPCC
ncbi:MAG: (d)CMP kinase [Dehalococcoidia bacterium]